MGASGEVADVADECGAIRSERLPAARHRRGCKGEETGVELSFVSAAARFRGSEVGVGFKPDGARRHGAGAMWEFNLWYVAAIVAASISEAILIGWLLLTRARCRRAEEALQKSQAQLATAVDSALTERITARNELNELKSKLEAESLYIQHELQLDQAFSEIIGQSDAIKYVTFKVNQSAPTDSTVLIMGETGTGKELVARAIHAASKRRDRVLIRVNCAALAPTLIESELFGHEKGAFTGAGARKIGRFELADGGTIFLDEIGELPLESQVKLLRVIQEGEFERVGGTKTIAVGVRIIAATNRNLKDEVDKGNFREDLWYRLNVFPITVPSLKQRPEDIPLLVEHFVQTFAREFGKRIDSVPARTLQSLQAHSWPGNVRELANVIERAVINTEGDVLHLADQFEHAKPETAPAITKTLDEVEREHILNTLENTGWRIDGPHGAAKVLGLNPSTLRTRMGKLQIRRRSAASG